MKVLTINESAQKKSNTVILISGFIEGEGDSTPIWSQAF